jgi:hypothetical protein
MRVFQTLYLSGVQFNLITLSPKTRFAFGRVTLSPMAIMAIMTVHSVLSHFDNFEQAANIKAQLVGKIDLYITSTVLIQSFRDSERQDGRHRRHLKDLQRN